MTRTAIIPRRALACGLALTLATALPALADFNDYPPEAKGQSPAFANQTRAPVMPGALRLSRTPLAEGLRRTISYAEKELTDKVYTELTWAEMN